MNENDLKQGYGLFFGLDRSLPSFDLPTLVNLKALTLKTQAVSARSPAPQIAADKGSEMATKRFPVLREVLVLCADGVEQVKPIAPATGVSAKSLRDTEALDTTAEALVQATGRAYDRASALIKCIAPTAANRAEKVLSEVQRRLDRGDATLDAPTARVWFTPLFNAYQATRARAERDKAALRKAAAPGKSTLEQAEKRLADTQLLEKLPPSKR